MSSEMQNYLIAAVIIAFFGYRYWRNMQTKKLLPEYLEKGAVIVDVRSPEEFKAGSNPKSINIPLGELSQKLHTLDKSKPVVLCCASGARSGMAMSILKENGFQDVINAGPWSNTQ